MSGPATRTGLLAALRRWASDSIAAGSGPIRGSAIRSITWPDWASASSFQSSIGSETKAGPFGASDAVWIARARACGTSCARGGSKLHLTNGWTTRVASRLVRLACIVIWARTCWPAVTSSGEWFACALKIAPMPLPTPGAVCRLTCAGRPEAWA